MNPPIHKTDRRVHTRRIQWIDGRLLLRQIRRERTDASFMMMTTLPELPVERIIPSEFDLSDCLDGVRRGEADAAAHLVQHLQPLLRRVVHHRCPWPTEPEDLYQAIFQKVFSSLDQFAGDSPFEHWVARIAVNTCLDHGRRRGRSRELRWADLGDEALAALEDIAEDAASGGPDETLAANDWLSWLLQLLSEEDRLVLMLIDVEEHTAGEVAQITGWSPSCVRVRAFRARARLRTHLEELQPELLQQWLRE